VVDLVLHCCSALAQNLMLVIQMAFKEALMQTQSERSTRTHAPATSIEVAKALFFAAAGISFLLSVALWFSGDHERGMFVGLWVPSICSAGALLLAGGNRG